MHYAVAKGNTIGVFQSWNDCALAVKGYKGAVYRKFESEEEAMQFVKEKSLIADSIPKEKKYMNTIQDISQVKNVVADLYVYTDGSCSNNGRSNAAAGIGIYFGENDPRNVSQRVEGKQTNNTAELTAILRVYPIIESDIRECKSIVILSDSEYAIRCVTHYGKKCMESNWDKDMPNKELVRQVYERYKDLPNVSFLHIMAHTGKSDIHSIGNDGADRLANLAIGCEECPYADKKIYLNVSFAEKDDAKQLGAKWAFDKKKWYVMENCPNKDILLERYAR